MRAEVGKQMADVKAAFTQAITDMKSSLHDDIAMINAKLDARMAQPPQPKAIVQPTTPKLLAGSEAERLVTPACTCRRAPSSAWPSPAISRSVEHVVQPVTGEGRRSRD